MHFHVLKLGDFTMLLEHPKLFENFVKLFFVGHRKNFLCRNLSVMQFDATVRQSGHDGIMRDHHDGASLLMKFAQQPQHDFFILRVEIAGRFVGQNNLGIVDQSARDTDTLLLAAR